MHSRPGRPRLPGGLQSTHGGGYFNTRREDGEMPDDAGPPPYLVTLGLDPASFDGLDTLRRRLFPPDRNLVPAHISLFHHLPGDEGGSIRSTLAEVASEGSPIPVRFAGLARLGRGIAVRVESPGLAVVHGRLARSFGRWLTPQDRQPFRPHVTLMNKADRDDIARAWDDLRAGWSPRDGLGVALLLWRYLGGPWEPVERFDFSP